MEKLNLITASYDSLAICNDAGWLTLSIHDGDCTATTVLSPADIHTLHTYLTAHLQDPRQ